MDKFPGKKYERDGSYSAEYLEYKTEKAQQKAICRAKHNYIDW